MNHQKSELYFLLTLLTIALVLTFWIFKPFITVLVLAIAFATIFQPLHKRALTFTRQRKGFSALLATLAVLVIVIVPLSFLGVQIFQEATQLYSSFVDNGGTPTLSPALNNAVQAINRFSPTPIAITVDVNQYIKQGLSWLIPHLDSVFANVAKALLAVFIFLVALYYLFKDGSAFKKIIVGLSPLRDSRDEIIFSKLTLAINSVIKGSLVVALVQGVLTAIGFSIFGIPNGILWGSVAAIAALIPGVGTALVIFPAVLYLYFTGNMVSTIGLLIWGVVAVGLVDNFLGPKLAGRGMQLHPFLILLSIFGGLAVFGPLGFLLGPLVLSLLLALLEIYSEIYKGK